MKLKKVITLFCLLVLSTQVLPLRQIGSILSSNQMTEELPHDAIGKGIAKFDPNSCDPFLAINFVMENISNSSKLQFIHFDTDLHSRHAGEIHVPPPNVMA